MLVYVMFVIVGVVQVKSYCTDSGSRTHTLLSSQLHGFPEDIKPAGLDEARVKYLYKEIREFCTPEIQDLVCPVPQTLNHFSSKKRKAN